MKKLFTTTLFIVFSLSFCKAQYVTIPDTTFANWLKTYYPTCMSGYQLDTTCSAMLATRSLGTFAIYPYRQIKVKRNIAGLKYFKNLDTVAISPSDTGCIGTYPPRLKYLDITYTNNLHHMPSPLPATLQVLICDDNLLKSLPPLPTGLKYLNCSHNHYYLTDLPPLPNSLDTLLDNNNFAYSLPALPEGLRYLNIYWNYMSVIPTLPSTLTYLNCGYQFRNLYSIPNLPAGLVAFDCDNNYLTSIPALPASLTYLDCSSNSLTTLPNLPPSLTYFNASYNANLKCIPVLKQFNTGLHSAFLLSGTQVTCLPNAIAHTGNIPAIDTMLICTVSDLQYCKANWNIKGTVFKDDNGDCIQQLTEQNVTAMRMNLYQAGKLVEFRYFQNGIYSFSTGLLPYHVAIDTTNFPFTFSCPASGDTLLNVSASDSLLNNVNFAVQCKPGFDLGVWDILSSRSWRQRFFPGDTMDMYVSAGDVIREYYASACGTDGISGKVKVVIGGPADYVKALLGALAPTLSGDTLIYTIADFSSVNPYGAFNFSIRAKNTATIGDQICFTVIVPSIAGDNNHSNNSLTHCFDVQNSFDPNEKEVSPPGNLTYPYNDWLTYTVHFQNTGTAAAQNIVVRDTLSSNLDPETFQLISASFPPAVSVVGNNVSFTFANIYLADSTTDKIGSVGYVEYRIKPLQNLPKGATINNKASIYFDFNPPVVTNTTTSNVLDATAVPNNIPGNAMELFPNPANEKLMVSSEQLAGSVIEITDILGQSVQTLTAPGNLITLNIKNLSQGVYFIVLHSPNGNEVRKFVKE